MDRESKMFLLFMAIVIIVFGIFAWFAVSNLEKRSDRCDELHGIMVKSLNGWVCIDAKVLK